MMENCSFHEMGLDDRLVKVKVILVTHVNKKMLSLCLMPSFGFVCQAIAKLNWSQPSPIQVSQAYSHCSTLKNAGHIFIEASTTRYLTRHTSRV